MNAFSEARFRTQVDNALQRVRTVLENTRRPQYPAEVPHQYDDKYSLAEFVTNAALAAQINCFDLLGLNEKGLRQLLAWAQTRSVTLRFVSEERCTFAREETRKVTSPTEHVTEVSGMFSKLLTVTDKVVTTVTEYFWKFDVSYELFAFQGNNPDDRLVLQKRQGSCEIVTSTNSTPRPQVTVVPALDVNITWLFCNISDNLTLKFSIDRSQKQCRTPRRNPNVEAALSYFKTFYNWAQQVDRYFLDKLFHVQAAHGLDLTKINDTSIFVPVVALFDETSQDAKKPLLAVGDLNQFLAEQKRSFGEKFSELAKMFPENGKIITVAESKLLVTLMHARHLAQHHSDGVDCIEAMLHNQLVAAVGKELTTVDFTNYMRYHNRQLFRQEYEPNQFCYAIRRPDHYPEGILSIEAQLGDGSLAEPILTTVRCSLAARPMHFALDAATKVAFHGERYLHAWISHQFAGQSGLQLSLNARARQFSSFILLVGTIASADLFEPKYAIIIQNKDDLKIPLLLEQIPTPKEFRDAIESMSPEQKRFAKAIRSMQLAGTLFGVCVIQIKPQLEKLLQLPSDSLTKEIKLTQDLLELFIQYQIPSDLLSYDGEANASGDVKLSVVKKYVATMQAMIQEARDQELALAREAQRLREAEEERRREIERMAREAQRLKEAEEEARRREAESRLLMHQLEETRHETASYRTRRSGGIFSAISNSLSTLMSTPSPSPNSIPDRPPMEYSMLELSDNFELRSASIESLGIHNQDKRVTTIQVTESGQHDTKPAKLDSKSVQGDTKPPQPDAKSAHPDAKPAQPDAKLAQPDAKPPQPDTKPAQPDAKPSDPANVRDLEPVVRRASVEDIDYTKVPGELDSRFAKLDEDSALRPTIIKPGDTWTKRHQKALLSEPTTDVLSTNEQKTEKQRAFDLLDALSRAGALSIDAASLHVVLAATHCFDKSLINTVIQDNVNPIEKVERSTLIVATTIQNKSAADLIKHEQYERVKTFSPALFAPSVGTIAHGSQ